MNPFEYYTHKPRLAEAALALAVAWFSLRRASSPTSRRLVALGFAWAGLGLLDYLIYAFGYSVFGWVGADVDAAQTVLDWVRVVVVGFAAVLLLAQPWDRPR